MKKKIIFVTIFLLTIGSGITYYLLSKEEKLVIATLYPLQKEALDQFIEEHYSTVDENVKFEIVSIFESIEELGNNWPHLDKIMALFIENENVDLVYGFPNEYLEGLIESKAIIELDPFIRKSKFPLENISSVITAPLEKIGQGKIYALSPGFANAVLLYNKRMFEELNLEAPKKPTWDEVKSIAEAIEQKGHDDITPITVNYAPAEYFYYDYKQIAAPIQENYIKDNDLNINNETNIKYWKFFSELYKNYSHTLTSESFFEDRVAMAIVFNPTLEYYFNNKRNIPDYKDVDMGITSVPVFNDEKIGSTSSANHMAIARNSKNKNNAWEFIQYTNGKEFAILQAEHGVSPFEGGITSYWDEDIKDIYIRKYNVDFTPFHETNGIIRPKPLIPAEVERYIDEHSTNYFSLVLNNEITVEEALQIIEDEARENIGGLGGR